MKYKVSNLTSKVSDFRKKRKKNKLEEEKE